MVEKEGSGSCAPLLLWNLGEMSGCQCAFGTRTSDKSASLLSCWLSLLLSADQMMYSSFEEAVITEEAGSTFLWCGNGYISMSTKSLVRDLQLCH